MTGRVTKAAPIATWGSEIGAALGRAREIFAESGTQTAPVPVERIARRMQVQVRYAPLDGDISGMASIRDGVRIIGVNSLHHPNRQRFTLSHELGHLLLHEDVLLNSVHLDKGSLYRDSLSSQGVDVMERQANAFASELLMPEPLVAAALGPRVDIEDDETVARLARKFRVSVAAMHYRLIRI